MKKLLAVFIIALFAITACSKKDGAKGAAAGKQDPVTITAYMPMQPAEKAEWFTEDAPGMVVIKEKTGVTVSWQPVPTGSGQLADESFNLLMASGELPDFVISDIGRRLKLFPKAWLPIDPIIKKQPERYPNLKKYVLEDPYLNQWLADEEGNIRYVPMIATRRIGDIFIFRSDLLQKYGLPPPVTADDWYTVLKAAKADGKVGFMTRYNRAGILYRLLAGYMDCVIEDYFVEDGKVKYGALDPRLKEGVELARKWYAEGLIDPEYPSTNSNLWWESFVRGDVLATHDNIARIWNADQEFIQNQKSERRVMGVGPMQSPRTGLRQQVIHYPHVRDRSAAISANAKYPERVLDYFEYCFSDEGFILMNFGIEGQSFDYIDGKPIFNTDYDLKVANGEVKHVLTTRDMPKNQKNELIYDFELDREDHAAVRDARDLYESNDFIRENWIASLSFTEDERSELAPLRAELDTYRGEWLDKFIMGIEPMSKWDAFTAQLQKMNLQRTIDIHQAALDRLLK